MQKIALKNITIRQFGGAFLATPRESQATPLQPFTGGWPFSGLKIGNRGAGTSANRFLVLIGPGAEILRKVIPGSEKIPVAHEAVAGAGPFRKGQRRWVRWAN